MEEGMTPRLLLVEDDAISRGFLTAALEALPVQVDSVATCAEALALPARFDLWLIDANLPDGDGACLLRRLRARWPDTQAVAHTADPSPSLRQDLLRAGFVDVLVKPMTAAWLQQRIRGLLRVGLAHAGQTPELTTPSAQDWDDDSALQALGGNAAHMALLRQLFLDELPAARAQCLDAFDSGDDAALRAALHKLRASCGFVGASRLADVVGRWHDAPRSPTLREAFVLATDALQRG
jgi:CheY-like chemotaxis protein/HPt (histidine-containing phosphotransfer) domain-containing protein